jgi:hypothetical protein
VLYERYLYRARAFSQETFTRLLSLKHYDLEAVKNTYCFLIRGEASAVGFLDVRDDVHVATALHSTSLIRKLSGWLSGVQGSPSLSDVNTC